MTIRMVNVICVEEWRRELRTRRRDKLFGSRHDRCSVHQFIRPLSDVGEFDVYIGSYEFCLFVTFENVIQIGFLSIPPTRRRVPVIHRGTFCFFNSLDIYRELACPNSGVSSETWSRSVWGRSEIEPNVERWCRKRRENTGGRRRRVVITARLPCRLPGSTGRQAARCPTAVVPRSVFVLC